jgi:GNAT superfamily N-acetyltransferase
VTADADEMFEPQDSDEHQGTRWVTKREMDGMDLHPDFANEVKHQLHLAVVRQGAWTHPGPRPAFPFTGDETREELNTPEADKKMKDHYEAKHAWLGKMHYGLTMGHIEPQEAADAGVHDLDTRSFKDLPQKPLYHATVAKDKVLSDGLKSGREVGHYGLGYLGGGGDEISVTENPHYAHVIAQTLREAHDVATGKTSTEDLLREADENHVGQAVRKGYETQKGPIEHLRTGIVRRHSMGLYTREMMHDEDGQSWEPDTECPTHPGGIHNEDGDRHQCWRRSMGEDEKADKRLALFNTLLWHHPKKENPVGTFMADNLRKIKRDQIGVVEVHPKPGVRGHYVPAEEEWRTWTGDAFGKPREHAMESTAGMKGNLPEGLTFHPEVEDTGDFKFENGEVAPSQRAHVIRARIPGHTSTQDVGTIEWTHDGQGGPRCMSSTCGHEASVGNIWVHPRWQRRGIATALFQKARAIAPGLSHSDVREPEGEAWVKALPTELGGEGGPHGKRTKNPPVIGAVSGS